MENNIHIIPFPVQETDRILEDLYANVDQSHCLVYIETPLLYPQTADYVAGIQSGEINGMRLICDAIMLDDHVIGKIEVTISPDCNGELDIILRKEYCHKGIGTKALQMFMDELVRKQLCDRLYAYVGTDNIPCGRMLMNCAFQAGRRFQADVLTPVNGTYKIQTHSGIEMIYEFK